MSECVVCKCQVFGGATHCSVKCLHESVDKSLEAARSQRNEFMDSMRAMQDPAEKAAPQVEGQVITIKHRWLKNRNVVTGPVIMSFNDKGIASIPEVGNNLLYVESYIRSSKGLAKIITGSDEVSSEEKKVEVKPKVVVPAKEEKPKVAVKAKSEANTEVKPKIIATKSNMKLKDSFVEKKPPIGKRAVKKPVGK